MFELPTDVPWLATGRLGRLRLASLLQLVEGEALSGAVVVGRCGEVVAWEGTLVGASCLHLTGAAALRELFLASDVAFGVEARAVEPRRELLPLVASIMDGTRLADEWGELNGARIVWEGEPDTSLPAGLGEALGAATSVWQATVRAGLLPTEVVDPLRASIESGRARTQPMGGAPPWTWVDHVRALRGEAPRPVAAPPAPLSPEPLPADEDSPADLLDHARRLVRSERLEEAIHTFEAVLRADPSDRVALQNLRRVRALLDGAGRPGAAR